MATLRNVLFIHYIANNSYFINYLSYFWTKIELSQKEVIMPKYVIEREVEGAGKLTPKELQDIAQTSCGVLENLGPKVQWQETFVTPNKIYCVFIAENEELIRKHAEMGGFPANQINEITSVIDPTAAEVA